MENDNSGNGSAGGVKDGVGVRRADRWQNSDVPSLGWLPETPVQPAGGAYQAIGPGSAAWASRNAARTLGDQGRGKPKR